MLLIASHAFVCENSGIVFELKNTNTCVSPHQGFNMRLHMLVKRRQTQRKESDYVSDAVLHGVSWPWRFFSWITKKQKPIEGGPTVFQGEE